MDARTEFGQLVQQVTSFVGDRDLDAALAADLNDACLLYTSPSPRDIS